MNLATAHPNQNEFGEAETNDIVIRSYTPIGKMQGLGSIEVEARESVIPDRRFVSYFVRVMLQTGGDYPQTAAALIYHENVDKLLSSLKRLENASITTERFAFSELEFDVDGLSIIVFNDANGKLMFVISASGVSVHFRSLPQLSVFANLIEEAQRHLQLNQIAF